MMLIIKWIYNIIYYYIYYITLYIITAHLNTLLLLVSYSILWSVILFLCNSKLLLTTSSAKVIKSSLKSVFCVTLLISYAIGHEIWEQARHYCRITYPGRFRTLSHYIKGLLYSNDQLTVHCPICVCCFRVFRRVLPLPNGNWNTLVDDWCCHPDPFANKKLLPQQEDCLLGDTYFLLTRNSSCDQSLINKVDLSDVSTGSKLHSGKVRHIKNLTSPNSLPVLLCLWFHV